MAKKINDDSDADVSQNVVNWERAEIEEMRESEKMFIDYAKSLPVDGSRRSRQNFITLRRVKLDWLGYDKTLEYNMRVTKPHLYRWERNAAHAYVAAYDRPYAFYDWVSNTSHGYIEAYDRPDVIFELSTIFPVCWFRL